MCQLSLIWIWNFLTYFMSHRYFWLLLIRQQIYVDLFWRRGSFCNDVNNACVWSKSGILNINTDELPFFNSFNPTWKIVCIYYFWRKVVFSKHLYEYFKSFLFVYSVHSSGRYHFALTKNLYYWMSTGIELRYSN